MNEFSLRSLTPTEVLIVGTVTILAMLMVSIDISDVRFDPWSKTCPPFVGSIREGWDCQHLQVPEVMAVTQQLVELAKRVGKHLMHLLG